MDRKSRIQSILLTLLTCTGTLLSLKVLVTMQSHAENGVLATCLNIEHIFIQCFDRVTAVGRDLQPLVIILP